MMTDINGKPDDVIYLCKKNHFTKKIKKMMSPQTIFNSSGFLKFISPLDHAC